MIIEDRQKYPAPSRTPVTDIPENSVFTGKIGGQSGVYFRAYGRVLVCLRSGCAIQWPEGSMVFVEAYTPRDAKVVLQ